MNNVGYALWIGAVSVCSVVGAFVIGAFTVSILSELVSTVRQAGRVAAVSVRGFGERRRPTSREFLFALRREFLSSYSSLRIGSFEVPHNPSLPIKRWNW